MACIPDGIFRYKEEWSYVVYMIVNATRDNRIKQSHNTNIVHFHCKIMCIYVKKVEIEQSWGQED